MPESNMEAVSSVHEKKESDTDLEAMSKRIEEIYVSVEKTRKYFMWTLIITIVTIVLPLIALIIVIPIFMNSLTKAYGL